TLGYVTVGELIDPTDWELNANRTADELANKIVQLVNLNRGSANVVLLHNAGGDRSNTVEALRRVVPELKEAGFRFVTVSQVLGTTRDNVMPEVDRNQIPLAGLAKIAFAWILTLENLLALALVLGVS